MIQEITAEMFEKATGQEPVQDDLARVNCERAGEIGHMDCGWCTFHNKPHFMCGCRVRVKRAVDGA